MEESVDLQDQYNNCCVEADEPSDEPSDKEADQYSNKLADDSSDEEADESSDEDADIFYDEDADESSDEEADKSSATQELPPCKCAMRIIDNQLMSIDNKQLMSIDNKLICVTVGDEKIYPDNEMDFSVEKIDEKEEQFATPLMPNEAESEEKVPKKAKGVSTSKRGVPCAPDLRKKCC